MLGQENLTNVDTDKFESVQVWYGSGNLDNIGTNIKVGN